MMYLVRNTFYEFTPIWLRNIQLAIAETSAWEWYCREAGYYIRKRRQNHGNFSDKIMAIFWQNHYNIFDKILEIYFDKIMATSLTKSWQYLWQDQYNLTKPWQQNWQNCGKILKKYFSVLVEELNNQVSDISGFLTPHKNWKNDLAISFFILKKILRKIKCCQGRFVIKNMLVAFQPKMRNIFFSQIR